MKYFIFLVFSVVALSQNTAYEKFQKYIQSSKGSIIQVEYFQIYLDEEVFSSGIIYVKDKMYIYDNEKQFVKFENGLITTINKPIKQVVYDSINKNDVTMFDILTGANNNNIHFDDGIIENDQIRIPFYVDLWEIKGSIWIYQQDGSPAKVTFIQDEDLKIQIDIKSISQAEFNSPKYDISDYEVINLIE